MIMLTSDVTLSVTSGSIFTIYEQVNGVFAFEIAGETWTVDLKKVNVFR